MFKYATPEGNKQIKITPEEFIKLYNEDKAVLLDIRLPFELKAWQIPFALHIPADELDKKANSLPKDKIIVTACPMQNRSPFAAMYLNSLGYNAKYLEEGLISLMSLLKGGGCKKIKL